jgi:type II secretory pathway pseudopilin PulG
MKKQFKSVYGVTLLEIMLVLAIAAMIIVMSVRYYQSAQASSQANAFVAQVQAIASAAENLAQGGGTFPSLATLSPMLPPNTLTNPPWGGTLTYAATATGFTLAIGTAPGTATCSLILAKLLASSQFTGSTCTSVTYSSSQ